MHEKRKLFVSLLLAALFTWLPIKLYNSIHKSEYLDHNFDLLIGEISFWESGRIIKELKESRIKNKQFKEIRIGINSPGGSVLAGLDILAEMRNLKSDGYKIKCYVNNAYSMGFVLLTFCDERIGRDTSTFMHHLTQINGGRPKRNKKNKTLFKALDFFDNILKEEMAAKFGISKDEFHKLIKEDKWWNAKDALRFNIIDRIENFTFYKTKYRIIIDFLENKENSNGRKIKKEKRGRHPRTEEVHNRLCSFKHTCSV